MNNWLDGLTFPMPKIYVPDTDFVGKKVTLQRCEFHGHMDPAEGFTRKDVSLTGNCNCKLKGKTLTITGLKETLRARFYRSTCYTDIAITVWFAQRYFCLKKSSHLSMGLLYFVERMELQ